jgi:ABC-type multidrug transport system fused ATPase/permease subunit
LTERQQLLKIRYKTTLDDVLELASFHYSISPNLQRSLQIARWISVILFVLLAIIGLIMKSKYLAFGGLIFAIGYFFYIGNSHRKRYLKNFTRMYEKVPQKSQIGEHKLSFNDIGITEESAASVGTTAWRGIERIKSTPDHTFIYVGPVSAYVIPRAGVIEGDYNSFVAELVQRYDAIRQSTN